MSKLTEAVLRSDIAAIKKTIASGDDLNELDGVMTPLLWAVFRGDLDAVRLLLESWRVVPTRTYALTPVTLLYGMPKTISD